MSRMDNPGSRPCPRAFSYSQREPEDFQYGVQHQQAYHNALPALPVYMCGPQGLPIVNERGFILQGYMNREFYRNVYPTTTCLPPLSIVSYLLLSQNQSQSTTAFLHHPQWNKSHLLYHLLPPQSILKAILYLSFFPTFRSSLMPPRFKSPSINRLSISSKTFFSSSRSATGCD